MHREKPDTDFVVYHIIGALYSLPQPAAHQLALQRIESDRPSRGGWQAREGRDSINVRVSAKFCIPFCAQSGRCEYWQRRSQPLHTRRLVFALWGDLSGVDARGIQSLGGAHEAGETSPDAWSNIW